MTAPCDKYWAAAALVRRAARLLDPVDEQRRCNNLASELESAGRDVHATSCVPMARALGLEAHAGPTTLRA